MWKDTILMDLKHCATSLYMFAAISGKSAAIDHQLDRKVDGKFEI